MLIFNYICWIIGFVNNIPDGKGRKGTIDSVVTMPDINIVENGMFSPEQKKAFNKAKKVLGKYADKMEIKRIDTKDLYLNKLKNS